MTQRKSKLDGVAVIALVACCAVAVKFVFSLRISYWIVFLLVLAALAILTFGIQARVFLG